MIDKREFNLGSDYSDVNIFPQIVEMATTNIVKQQEKYVLQKLMEVNIDPNTLQNQLREIHRLNVVIEQLEKALDKACKVLSDESLFPCEMCDDDITLSQCYKCRDDYVDVEQCWKEWCLKDD